MYRQGSKQARRRSRSNWSPLHLSFRHDNTKRQRSIRMASSRHKELRLEFLAYHFPQTEAVGGDGDRLLLKYSVSTSQLEHLVTSFLLTLLPL